MRPFCAFVLVASGLGGAVAGGAVAGGADADVCWKDTYGRGVGKPIHTCHDGFEQDAGLCYPPCKQATPSFYGVGPVCWQHCEPGWVDEGALCRKDGSIETVAKKSYGRGVGTPLVCADDEDEDAALCYTQCRAGFAGNGPVCWVRCPTSDPTNGGALCCRNATVCTDKIEALSLGLPLAVAKALISGGNATKIEEDVKEAVEAVLGFVMPLCSQENATSV